MQTMPKPGRYWGPRELLQPELGYERGQEASPTRQNALRAARRILRRYRGDTEVLAEDVPGLPETDEQLVLAWCEARGMDDPAVLAELRRRADSPARIAHNGHGAAGRRRREATALPQGRRPVAQEAPRRRQAS